MPGLLDRARRTLATNPERRLSIERLAVFHVAAKNRGVEGDIARRSVSLADVDGLRFGNTFARTIALNEGRIQLYEEKADVRRIM